MALSPVGTGREHAMAYKKNIHTVPTDDGWANRREGGKRGSSTHATKAEAQAAGRAAAMKDGVEHLIHKKDGTIGDRNSYGNDRHPPRVERPPGPRPRCPPGPSSVRPGIAIALQLQRYVHPYGGSVMERRALVVATLPRGPACSGGGSAARHRPRLSQLSRSPGVSRLILTWRQVLASVVPAQRVSVEVSHR